MTALTSFSNRTGRTMMFLGVISSSAEVIGNGILDVGDQQTAACSTAHCPISPSPRRIVFLVAVDGVIGIGRDQLQPRRSSDIPSDR